MSESEIFDVVKSAFNVIFEISAPTLIAAMVAGLIIGLLQALTQIQEMTLTFVPKLFVIAIIIGITLPTSYYALEDFVHGELVPLMIYGK